MSCDVCSCEVRVPCYFSVFGFHVLEECSTVAEGLVALTSGVWAREPVHIVSWSCVDLGMAVGMHMGGVRE